LILVSTEPEVYNLKQKSFLQKFILWS